MYVFSYSLCPVADAYGSHIQMNNKRLYFTTIYHSDDHKDKFFLL